MYLIIKNFRKFAAVEEIFLDENELRLGNISCQVNQTEKFLSEKETEEQFGFLYSYKKEGKLINVEYYKLQYFSALQFVVSNI